MGITTRAAVCRVPGQPWEITELELDEPRANEVRIKFYAAGLCHSDDHIQKGDAPMRMPVVGGHEGAGIVESVGPSVTRVKVGDHDLLVHPRLWQVPVLFHRPPAAVRRGPERGCRVLP